MVKILLALNHQFFTSTPEEIITLLGMHDPAKKIAGFEVSFHFSNPEEQEYIRKFFRLCVKYRYELQIRGMTESEFSLQKKYLVFCGELAKLYTQQTTLVYQPIEACDVEKNVRFLKLLMEYIDRKMYPLQLEIENCFENNTFGFSYEKLLPILKEVKTLHTTYQIEKVLLDKFSAEYRSLLQTMRFTFLPADMDNQSRLLGFIKLVKKIRYQKKFVLECPFSLLNASDSEQKFIEYVRLILKDIDNI